MFSGFKEVVGLIEYEEIVPDRIHKIDTEALNTLVEEITQKEWCVDENNTIVHNGMNGHMTTTEVGDLLLHAVQVLRKEGIRCMGDVAILSLKTGHITRVILDEENPNPMCRCTSTF